MCIGIQNLHNYISLKVCLIPITFYLPLVHIRCYLLYMITLRHTTFGRPPLDKGSARRTDLCLATHNNHKRQTSTPPSGLTLKTPN